MIFLEVLMLLCTSKPQISWLIDYTKVQGQTLFDKEIPPDE